MQGVSQVQMRVEPQGIDLEQTHLKRNERFFSPLFPRKVNGVLSSGQIGIPCSSKEASEFFELRLFKCMHTRLNEKSFSALCSYRKNQRQHHLKRLSKKALGAF